MCLFIDKNFHKHGYQIKKAEKDIECFKILLKYPWSHSLETACMCAPVKDSYITDNIPFYGDSNGFRRWLRRVFHTDRIGGGYIHTYNARRVVENWIARESAHVYRCIIPKGTYYYVGRDEDYASEYILFREELTTQPKTFF